LAIAYQEIILRDKGGSQPGFGMRRNYTIRYEEYIYETSTSLKMGLRRMKKWLTYARLIFGKTADTLEAHLEEMALPYLVCQIINKLRV